MLCILHRFTGGLVRLPCFKGKLVDSRKETRKSIYPRQPRLTVHTYLLRPWAVEPADEKNPLFASVNRSVKRLRTRISNDGDIECFPWRLARLLARPDVDESVSYESIVFILFASLRATTYRGTVTSTRDLLQHLTRTSYNISHGRSPP